jgi:hypothetical protein
VPQRSQETRANGTTLPCGYTVERNSNLNGLRIYRSNWAPRIDRAELQITHLGYIGRYSRLHGRLPLSRILFDLVLTRGSRPDVLMRLSARYKSRQLTRPLTYQVPLSKASDMYYNGMLILFVPTAPHLANHSPESRSLPA